MVLMGMTTGLQFGYTCIISKSRYLRKKEVQFNGTTNWIKRNEFSYTVFICK